MGNQNVQLIGVEECTLEQKLNVVMWSGLVTNGSQSGSAKKNTKEWVWKSTVKPPIFELQKEKETFLQAWRDFCNAGASYSKTNAKGKGITRTPLQSDPFASEDQQRLNIIPSVESEPTRLVRSFLQSCRKLLRDEQALLEMQNLINKCEQPISLDATNRYVHHIKKYIRTGREMQLSA